MLATHLGRPGWTTGRNVVAPLAPRFLQPAGDQATGAGVIGLRDALFQVFPFETRRRGESATCPARTVGTINLLLGNGQGGLNVGPDEAVEVALRNEAEPVPAEAAKEKVVFCNRLGRTLVFQADLQSQSAALCACGNATGAAAAILAHRLNRSSVHQDLQVPDGRLAMSSSVTRLGAAIWCVEQTWLGIRFQVREAEMNGRQVAICTGSFNDYLVVQFACLADLERFDLPEVLALWREAQRFSGFHNPLQSRLVALAPREGAPPFAKFYTCGRGHPGAPLTGMATLALASRRVAWLAALLSGGLIEHRRGLDQLPCTAATPRGDEIGFPAIDVTFKGI